MPAVSRITASIKASMRSVDTGTKKRHSSATISAIGSTELSDSRSFSASIVLTRIASPLFKCIRPFAPETGKGYAEQDEKREEYAWIVPDILEY